MTIDELLALTGLTGSDEIPVWDAEASGEPTKKITAQNFAAAVKTLASLLGTSDVVNDLFSTSTTAPLSANMGKTLNDKINTQNVSNYFTANTSAISFDSSNSYCKKSANTIELQIRFTPSSSGTLNLGTVSNEIKPTHNISTIGLNNTDDTAQGNIILQTNNRIDMYSAVSGKVYIVRFVYIVQ